MFAYPKEHANTSEIDMCAENRNRSFYISIETNRSALRIY